MFNGVKVISATMVAQRQALGETATAWLMSMQARPGFKLVDRLVVQSSDDAFHCTSLIFFYTEDAPKVPSRG